MTDIAVLWAKQVEKAYGWDWRMMPTDMFTLIAPDASFYIQPVHAMSALFRDLDKEDTLLILFDLLGTPEKFAAREGLYRAVAF